MARKLEVNVNSKSIQSIGERAVNEEVEKRKREKGSPRCSAS